MKYYYVNTLRKSLEEAVRIEKLRLDANKNWMRLKIDGKVEGPEAITVAQLANHISQNIVRTECLSQVLRELIDAIDNDGLHSQPTVSIEPHPPEVLDLDPPTVQAARRRFQEAEGTEDPMGDGDEPKVHP